MPANNTPAGDYIEQAHDERDYCEHGVFVGNPFGGDYMCHYCELGISVEEMQERQRAEARRKCRELQSVLVLVLENHAEWVRDAEIYDYEVVQELYRLTVEFGVIRKRVDDGEL